MILDRGGWRRNAVAGRRDGRSRGSGAEPEAVWALAGQGGVVGGLRGAGTGGLAARRRGGRRERLAGVADCGGRVVPVWRLGDVAVGGCGWRVWSAGVRDA